jgi:hypothetical protein
MSERYDTVFSLPSVDDDPDTEVGVLLMGLGPERLLAGLGVASREPGLTPAEVTMVVDQLRHGLRPGVPSLPGSGLAAAVAAGTQRWRVAREGLFAADLGPEWRSAALRQLWDVAARALDAGAAVVPQLRTAGGAERVYLIACWLRPEEITEIAEEHVVLPELPS